VCWVTIFLHPFKISLTLYNFLSQKVFHLTDPRQCCSSVYELFTLGSFSWTGTVVNGQPSTLISFICCFVLYLLLLWLVHFCCCCCCFFLSHVHSLPCPQDLGLLDIFVVAQDRGLIYLYCFIIFH